LQPADKSEVEGSALRAVATEDNAPDFLAEGSRFGPYRIGARIGRGGMACIYRAEHLGLRRQVALKVLTGEVAAGAESRTRFIREARIAAAIKHPSVVDIYDVGVHDDVPFLVMELLVGQDLESFLTASGVPDEGALLDIVIPVVAGLAAVHDAGVVHRDLKPGNIFLSKRGDGSIEPRLLDFGISRSFWRNEPRLTAVRQGVLIGTPLYMSPEAMLGREITPLSDQYSLGVVLYECTSGVNPFVANNIAEIVRRVTTGDFTPLGAQPTRPSRRLADIIARAMSVEPEQRFPDMRALGRELMMLSGVRTRLTWGQAFGGDLHAMALVRQAQPEPEPSRPAEASPPRRGSRALALGAAAVLGGVAFGVGQMLLFRSSPAASSASSPGAPAVAPAVDGASVAPPVLAPASTIAALRPASSAPAPSEPGEPESPDARRTATTGSNELGQPERDSFKQESAEHDDHGGSGRDRPPAKQTASAKRESSGRTSGGRRTTAARLQRRSAPKASRNRDENDERSDGRPEWLAPPRATTGAGGPDWLPPGASPSPRRPDSNGATETGTNDAPILD
jgi:serine/threonine-protein kinase